MTEYHKLWAPFKRVVVSRNDSYLDESSWARPEFGLLQDLDWTWTEKINGTNIRIIWDGHKVTIRGRTDNASLELWLTDWLRSEFFEERLESQFHSDKAVLYGELYGARVVAGSGVYSPDPGFALFDVKVGDWWLLYGDVAKVADGMGLRLVPHRMFAPIWGAVATVKDPHLKSHYGDFKPEGLVGKPPLGITGRDGDRLMLKIKPKDFR